MGVKKRLLDHGPVQGALAALVAGYLKVLRGTVRWQVICPPETEALLNAETPAVACFWHGRIAMMPAAWPRSCRTASVNPNIEPGWPG